MMSRSIRLIPILLALLVTPSMLRALTAEVSVDAKLSHRVTEVGAPMQLEIAVSGGEVDGQAPQVEVDGLQIDFVGPSRSFSLSSINGRTSRRVDTTYVYQAVAKRE